MKKFILPIVILIIISLIVFKKDKKEYYKIVGQAQGTTYSVIYSTNKKLDLSDSIGHILQQFDLSLSSYIPSSIISKINRNEENVMTDSLFNKVFNLSKEINKISGGYFDITVAPLVNAWGFGWEKNSFPGENKIDSIMEFVGMDKVELKDNKVTKKDPRVQLDVNAIAQGYSADVISSFLDQWSIEDYMVEVGGEVQSKGQKQNKEYWKIGIEKPSDTTDMENRQIRAIVNLNNKALATSGNYRKFYEKDGIKYVHTIDPKTGKTIQNDLLSASVLTTSCARADALATTFMVMGFKKSRDFIKTLNNIDVYFVYADTTGNIREWSTPGFQKALNELE